jgi:hypothetical protein
MTDTHLQQMLILRCHHLRVGEVTQLGADVCERAWPSTPETPIYEPIDPTAIWEADLALPTNFEVRVVPAQYTCQLMQTALGSDFVVDRAMYQMAYRVGRKENSSHFAPTKPATTRNAEPPPRASKPTPKRVKPGDHMKETPLVQRFSQLDLD